MAKNKKSYVKIRENRLIFIILSIILFFGIEVTARIYDWYRLYPLYDLLSHTLFGIAWCGLYWIIILIIQDNRIKKTFLKGVTISYIIVAGSWEIIEIIGDTLLFNTDYLKDVFIWDGLVDMIVGLIGVYITYYIIKTKLE